MKEIDLNLVEKNVMDDLKDFQKATVERIDCLYRNGQKRILVADEVGLGKTLIARGTIAKLAKLRKEEGKDFIKVIYICSNATIAEQNIEKLKIVKDISIENAGTSRLSMQHLVIFNQENDEIELNKHIQLIPFTPKTSLKIENSQGLKQERALICVILGHIPELERYYKKLKNLFKLNVGRNWNNLVKDYENQVRECNNKSNGEYLRYMVDNVTKELNSVKYKNKRLIRYLIHLCEKKHNSQDVRKCIIELRKIFANISLKKLNPDLIIMDEFQRFKELLELDETTDIGQLVSHFFNSDDSRILMLSATPYKIYSTLEEIDQEGTDAHYSEFFKVINFLINSKEEEIKFKEIWNDYSFKLKEIDKDKNSFIKIKHKAEKELYKNICRTERITESKLANIIDLNDEDNSLTVLKEDIRSYIEVQKLLDKIEPKTNVRLDYVKSSPYLMSFMKYYKLKKAIEKYFYENPQKIELMNQDTFWLDETKINRYEKISWNNARLENLMNNVFGGNTEKLLWVPPSKPYYDLGGPFKNMDEFSKTLIFSSWEMVPRMITSLVSYEVERRTIGELKKYDRTVKYFHDKNEKRYPTPRFTFSINENKPSQMILFLLLYPSMFLADVYDPIDCLNRNLSLENIKREVKQKISEKLNQMDFGDFGLVDSRWNYLAPLLLDNYCFNGYPNLWFNETEYLIYNKFSKNSGIKKHFKELENQFKDSLKYIGKIPTGLLDILTEVAIASPAICAFRSYQNISNNFNQCSKFATEFAKKFMDKMNVPESISVIDLINDSKEPYWRNLLIYSMDGNLQAVIDEYVHLLESGLDKNDENKLEIIHNRLLDSIDISTTSYTFDTYDAFNSRINYLDYSPKSLRTHFAVSFTKGKSDERDVNRKKSVRNSFNSPFRPFVLASTSIGQEGLDFHNYCRRVVHWNLPSNPIDLEQREGRIDRFECLAIRQNIAKRYGNIKFKTQDIWKELFDEANEKEKYVGCSDLMPYWGLSESDDMVKIERIVPMYPFSSDEIKYNRLKRVLSLYRLTLGQSRQEELLDSIFIDINEEDLKNLFINLSPFYKDFDDFECEKIKKQNNVDSESEIEGHDESVFPFSDILLQLTTNDEVNASNFNYNLVNEIDYDNYWKKLILKNYYFDESAFKKWSNQCYWISIPNIKLNLARIEMLIHIGYIEVKLFHDNIKHGKKLFDYLFDIKDEIENELGFELFWNKKPKNSYWRIALFVPIDIDNNEDESIKWHLFMAKRFDEVFSDKIRQYFNEFPLNYDNDKKTRYWMELTKKLSKTDIISNEVPQPHTWYCIILDNVPFSECRMELHAYTNKRQIKTSIIIEKSRRDLYQYLLKDKSAIENELGFELEWRKNKGRRYIRKTYTIDIRDEKNWQEAVNWHLECAQQFKEVIYPRINYFYDKL